MSLFELFDIQNTYVFYTIRSPCIALHYLRLRLDPQRECLSLLCIALRTAQLQSLLVSLYTILMSCCCHSIAFALTHVVRSDTGKSTHTHTEAGAIFWCEASCVQCKSSPLMGHNKQALNMLSMRRVLVVQCLRLQVITACICFLVSTYMWVYVAADRHLQTPYDSEFHACSVHLCITCILMYTAT